MQKHFSCINKTQRPTHNIIFFQIFLNDNVHITPSLVLKEEFDYDYRFRIKWFQFLNLFVDFTSFLVANYFHFRNVIHEYLSNNIYDLNNNVYFVDSVNIL